MGHYGCNGCGKRLDMCSCNEEDKLGPTLYIQPKLELNLWDGVSELEVGMLVKAKRYGDDLLKVLFVGEDLRILGRGSEEWCVEKDGILKAVQDEQDVAYDLVLQKFRKISLDNAYTIREDLKPILDICWEVFNKEGK